MSFCILFIFLFCSKVLKVVIVWLIFSNRFFASVILEPSWISFSNSAISTSCLRLCTMAVSMPKTIQCLEQVVARWIKPARKVGSCIKIAGVLRICKHRGITSDFKYSVSMHACRIVQICFFFSFSSLSSMTLDVLGAVAEGVEEWET